MGLSYVMISVWNMALLVAGIGLVYMAVDIANDAINKLPDYVSDYISGSTLYLDEALIIFGSCVAALAAWGCVAFTYKKPCMMITYMSILAVIILMQVAFGLLAVINKDSDTVPINDSGVQGSLQEALDQFYCVIPDPPGGELPLPANTPQAVIDKIDETIQTKYLDPLVELGITCTIPDFLEDKNACIENHQDPCQLAIVRWLNEENYGIGIGLLILAGIEFIILMFAWRYYRKDKKVSTEKSQKRRKATKKAKEKRVQPAGQNRTISNESDSVYTGYAYY